MTPVAAREVKIVYYTYTVPHNSAKMEILWHGKFCSLDQNFAFCRKLIMLCIEYVTVYTFQKETPNN